MIFILKLFYHYFFTGPKSAKKNKGHVFISYSWNEKEIVMKLRERLKVSNQDFLCSCTHVHVLVPFTVAVNTCSILHLCLT